MKTCAGCGEHERAPKPRVFYTVVWDYVGGDCGDLPAYCDTEEEAERYGQSWVDDTMDELRVTEPDLQPGDEGYPVFWVRRHEIFGGYDHVYDEDGKPLFTRVADIRRARR